MNSILLIITFAVMVLGVGMLVSTILHASDGYEDEEGFHQVTLRKSKSRSHRKRSRAVEPVIDIKAGALQ